MTAAAPCPRCGRPCAELLDPFGYHRKPPVFACSNCEDGDSPDGSVALGPLTFTLDESLCDHRWTGRDYATCGRCGALNPAGPAAANEPLFDGAARRPSCDLNQPNPED